MSMSVRTQKVVLNNGGSSNLSSLTLTPDATWQAGDCVVAWLSYTNSTAFTLPSGWTYINTGMKNSSTQVALAVAYKIFTSADLSATHTFSIGTATRFVGVAVAVTGVDQTTPIDNQSYLIYNNGSTAVTALATGTFATTSAPTFVLTGWAAKFAGAGNEALSLPGTHLEDGHAYSGASSVNVSLIVAELASQNIASGGTVGPYTANTDGTTVNYYITEQVALKAAATNTPPTTSAGADQTVLVGDLVSITATDTAGSAALSSGDWAQVGTTPSLLTLTKSGTRNATVQFTAPGTTGTYTLRRTVTDANGLTATDDVAVTVNLAGQISRPASDLSNAGGWTTSNGTTSRAALLRDGNVATYIESPQNPSGAAIKMALDPIVNPGSTAGWSYAAKLSKPSTTTSASVTVRIYNVGDNSTVATRTVTVTSTDPNNPNTFSWALTGTEASTVVDPANLAVEIDGTAS